MRLSPERARGLFAAARVARLATADTEGTPHLVPFTFAVDGDRIVHAVDHKPKASRSLRRLDNIVQNATVCALVDHYDDDWERLWWARADGTATVSSDPGDLERVAALLAAKYPQYGDHPPEGPAIVLTVTRWTGWSAR